MKKLCNILGCNRCYETDDPTMNNIDNVIALAFVTLLVAILFVVAIYLCIRQNTECKASYLICNFNGSSLACGHYS